MLVELFEAFEDFLCFDEDAADEDVLGSPGKRLLDFMLLLPPPVKPLALGSCCNDGGSSSFSGDEGPSLELVS